MQLLCQLASNRSPLPSRPWTKSLIKGTNLLLTSESKINNSRKIQGSSIKGGLKRDSLLFNRRLLLLIRKILLYKLSGLNSKNTSNANLFPK